ncbi:hypothetical protein CPB83DRAFT_846125, partial [Crepidotus variabilis]
IPYLVLERCFGSNRGSMSITLSHTFGIGIWHSWANNILSQPVKRRSKGMYLSQRCQGPLALVKEA